MLAVIGKNIMVITVKIDTSTPEGERLIEELRRYPDVVEFDESTIVSEPVATPYTTAEKILKPISESVKTISAAESAKLAFKRLGEKYNHTFDNKYTR